MSDSFLELGALSAYLLTLLWIGFRTRHQVKSSLDYALAGRSIPWIVLLATTGATMIGGGASVGMVSRVYEVGIAAAVITCAWHLQLIFVGLWAAPRLRRLNLITVGDYFHLRFGPVARELSVIVCLFFMIGILAAQMAAMGTVTNLVLGISYETALLIGAAVTVFYSTIGGMRAVVKTDVLQFIILVVGIGAAAAIVLHRSGGFAELAKASEISYFTLTGNWSAMRLVSLFCAFFLGEFFVPSFTVRCFSAKDTRQAQWGLVGAGVFLLLFMPISTFVLGMAAKTDPNVQAVLESERQAIMETAQEGGLPNPAQEAEEQVQQLVLPALVRTTFHPALAGILIAAIIAAVMSSADSILSCLSTVIMEDYYRRHINPGARDRVLLRVAQISTLGFGVSATVFALFFSNIAEILEFAYDFWAPTMVLPFLVGIFWFRKNRIYAVVVSMLSGLLATAIWRFALQSPGDLGPALFGFMVAVAAFFIAIPFTSRFPLSRFFQPGETACPSEGERL